MLVISLVMLIYHWHALVGVYPDTTLVMLIYHWHALVGVYPDTTLVMLIYHWHALAGVFPDTTLVMLVNNVLWVLCVCLCKLAAAGLSSSGLLKLS